MSLITWVKHRDNTATFTKNSVLHSMLLYTLTRIALYSLSLLANPIASWRLNPFLLSPALPLGFCNWMLSFDLSVWLGVCAMGAAAFHLSFSSLAIQHTGKLDCHWSSMYLSFSQIPSCLHLMSPEVLVYKDYFLCLLCLLSCCLHL